MGYTASEYDRRGSFNARLSAGARECLHRTDRPAQTDLDALARQLDSA
jgi:hypothetical protein